MRRSWTDDGAFVALLILVAVLAVYTPAITVAAFHFDDFHGLVENESVRTLSLRQIGRFYVEPALWSAEPGNTMWRPTPLVTAAVDHALWGYRAPGWILTNALLHAACAILVHRIARKIGLAPLAAAFAGGIAALHPVHSEVVNYASSRSESVAALFAFGAILMHLRGREREGAAALREYAGAAACFMLAMTSKETPAGLVLAIPLLELVLPRGGTQPRRLRAVSAFLLYGAILAAYFVVRARLIGHATAPVPVFRTPEGVDARTGGQVSILDNVLKTQTRVVAMYAQLLLFPVRLTADHDVLRTASWTASAAAALLLHLAALAWAVRLLAAGRRLAPLCFGLFWVLIAPSVAYPLNVVMNEHRLYLPGLAVALLGGAALARVAPMLRRPWLAAAPLALFVPLAVHRSFEWRSDVVLWTAAIERAPQSARARMHLGAALHEEANRTQGAGRLALLREAERRYVESDRLHPSHYDTQLNLGQVWLEIFRETGDRATGEASLEAYRAAGRIVGTDMPRPLLLQATVLGELGRYDEAVAIVRSVRAGDDTVTTLYDDLEGRLLRRKGDRAGAERCFLRLIDVEEPLGRVDGLLELGWWRLEDGDVAGARELIDRALALANRRTDEFRPFLYAARMLRILGFPDADRAGLVASARKRGWSAAPDEQAWVDGGPTPGAVRIGTRNLPTYGDPR
ncbi:MAG: hypothetical protein HMLKMBBP_01807 [Planctomycetes bacterium]|nr:hypothetical protein [Planctomycetota bacterium]